MTTAKTKGNKKTTKMENSRGARDSRREVPLPRPKEGSRLAKEIAGLSKLTKTQLWKRHREVFGTDSRSCNTRQLVSVIARRLAESATEKSKTPKTAPPDDRTTTTSEESSQGIESTAPHLRDSRLPKIGSILERDYKGKVHKVTVLEDAFEYEGRKYGSLSALAKEITGAIWNGWVWWGLAKRPESKKVSDAA